MSFCYRRETERYERNTAAIPAIREDLKRWLAEREAASPLLMQDRNTQQNAGE